MPSTGSQITKRRNPRASHLSKRPPTTRCNHSFAVLTAPPWKTGCCAPIRRNRRKARMLPVERRRRHSSPQPPMPSEPNNVPIVKSAVDEIASRRRAARLLPSWRRSCKPGLARPGGAGHPWSAVHTCEHQSQPAFIYPSYFQSVAIGLRRAPWRSMKYSWLGCLLLSSQLLAGTQDSDLNVNKRYTVDTVIVAGKGWKTNVADQETDKFSSGLRKDLVALIGQKLNPGTLDGLATRLKKELSASEVSHHVLRGDTPEHVRVEFEVKPPHYGVDATVTKFLYDSHQGWSAAGSVGFTVQQNTFGFGLASDGDALNERFAGLSARYENKHVGSDRVGLRFQFESYHEQWNRDTLDALAAQPNETSDAYRTRQNFQPTATISLAKPLTLEIGLGFERFQNQFPAAHSEAAG